jgi:hypothetical protein
LISVFVECDEYFNNNKNIRKGQNADKISITKDGLQIFHLVAHQSTKRLNGWSVAGVYVDQGNEF